MKFDRQEFTAWLRSQARGLETLGFFGNECIGCFLARANLNLFDLLQAKLHELGVRTEVSATILLHPYSFHHVSDLVDAVEDAYKICVRDSCCL